MPPKECMESCFYGYPKPAFLGRSQNMLRTVTSVERYRRYDYRRDKIVEINRYHVLILCHERSEKRCSWHFLLFGTVKRL